MIPPIQAANAQLQLCQALLQGSFDAGFLVEGSSGTILAVNHPAVNLFTPHGHKHTDTVNERSLLLTHDQQPRLIESLVKFWSYSLQEEADDDSVMADGNNSNGGPQPQQQQQKDTLPWSEVIQHASFSPTTAENNGPVLEWAVTCHKIVVVVDSNSQEENANDNDKEEEEEQPDMKNIINKQESFPGALLLTPIPGSDFVVVYIRHADHHDIIRSGSVYSTSAADSRVKRHSRRRASLGGGDRAPKISLDATGTIVAINDAALASNDKNLMKWGLTSDLVGKHVSELPALATKPVPATTAKQPQPPQYKGMLDFILESGMEPGHAACPMSGFALRLDNKTNMNHLPDAAFSAMTTGGGMQRDENITEAAFEAALDPIFQIDEHGTVQMVNSAACHLFGWSRHEFIGSNISRICGAGHDQHHDAYMARYLATGDTRVIGKNRKLVAKKKNGTEFPIELGVVEVDTFAGDVRLFCGFVRDLTGIQAKEQMAQDMVEAALDPMFQINHTGRILMVNQAALTTFGYDTREELVGQNIKVICGGSHGHNHDLYIKRYLRTGETRVIGKYRELPAKRKNGTEFPIRLAVVEIGDRNGEKRKKSSSSNNLMELDKSDNNNQQQPQEQEERLFCGFVHDLSRQKRDEEIMRGTIDTSLDPVLHINENGIIIMVNNAVCKHLGWTREELLGENVSLIVGGEHAEKHGEYIERYLATGEKRAMGKKRKLTARRKDGSEMPIELGLSEIKISGGQERLFCAFLTDLSGRQSAAAASASTEGGQQ